jgi:hypothetical protein
MLNARNPSCIALLFGRAVVIIFQEQFIETAKLAGSAVMGIALDHQHLIT